MEAVLGSFSSFNWFFQEIIDVIMDIIVKGRLHPYLYRNSARICSYIFSDFLTIFWVHF